jgi:hypothetical protein
VVPNCPSHRALICYQPLPTSHASTAGGMIVMLLFVAILIAGFVWLRKRH